MQNKMSVVGIIVAIFFVISAYSGMLNGEASISDYAGENIQYLIKPLGESEYNDFGLVDYNGTKVNLVTFRTKVLFFEDTEKIYSSPESLLPYRIERSISKLWGKEYITEEYDQEKFIVVIRKFNGVRLVNEKIVQSNGPIQNAIMLPFYLRNRSDLEIGWHINVRVPDEFRVELVSIDEIKIPAGTFQAYHFKSFPDKFEIWVNKTAPRVPLKIQGKGVLGYVLVMKDYDSQKK